MRPNPAVDDVWGLVLILAEIAERVEREAGDEWIDESAAAEAAEPDEVD
jgi:hypothetical protein